MNLQEMSRAWGKPFAVVHSAACKVRGGKLPRGRTHWTRDEEDAIRKIVLGDDAVSNYM